METNLKLERYGFQFRFHFTGLHPVPRMGYGLAYGEPLSFRADHPFVYHVWDRKLKTPIFSGRVVKLGNTTKYRSATIYQDEL